MEQRTEEWFQARLGKVTASRVSEVCAKTKAGWGASRASYMAQLVAERLTGRPADAYTSAAMQWGTEAEPHARAAYEFFSGLDVAEIGFVPHPCIADSGASPDGLVGTDGLVEIKCPNTATHISSLLGGSIDRKYAYQMQWQMACTGRAWCDFVSFDPRLPPEIQVFSRRVDRDDPLIDEIEGAVSGFILELDETVRKLREMYPGVAS